VIIEEFGISRFDILATPGTRSGAQSVGSPKVTKCNKPAELGCGHGKGGHMERGLARGINID
jgi:hypothetical protein